MAKYCGKCGEAVNVNVKYCGKCGNKLTIEEPIMNNQSYQRHQSKQVNKSSKSKWILILLVAIIAIILLFVLVDSGKMDDGLNSQNNSTDVIKDGSSIDIHKPIEKSEIYGVYTAVVDVSFNEFIDQVEMTEDELLMFETANAGRVTIEEDRLGFDFIDAEEGAFVPAGEFQMFTFDKGTISGYEQLNDFTEIELSGDFSRDIYQDEVKLVLDAQINITFLLQDGEEAIITYTFNSVKN